MPNYDDLPYRPCVGLVLLNRDGKIFLGERIDTPGAWQMPQGGIDDGEDVRQAALRELAEEVGTDKAEIITILPNVLRYDLPPHLMGRLWNGAYRGQAQNWVVLRFKGTDADINVRAHTPPEFGAWTWAEADEAAIIDLIVPFKIETYKAVFRMMRADKII